MDLAKENKLLKAELEKVRAALAKSETTCMALQKDLAEIDDSYQKRLGKQAERLAFSQNEVEKLQLQLTSLSREKKDLEDSISADSQRDTTTFVTTEAPDSRLRSCKSVNQEVSDTASYHPTGLGDSPHEEHDSSNESSSSHPEPLGNIGKCSTDGSSAGEKGVTSVSTPESDPASPGRPGPSTCVLDSCTDTELNDQKRYFQLEAVLDKTRKENSELKSQLEEKDMELARVRETATWQDLEMIKLRGMVKELSFPESTKKDSEADPKMLAAASEKIKTLEKQVAELANAKKKRPKFWKHFCLST